MDWIYMLQAVVLGIVEGLTEFLPVSSTGHLIVAADLVNFTGKGADTFVIAIQAGAILAVCWYYRERIAAVLRGLFSDKKQQNLAVNTIVAFLPAAVVGVMVSSLLKKYLFNPITVEDSDAFRRQCVERSEEEAVAGGLLDEAKTNAEGQLTQIFNAAFEKDTYTLDFTYRDADGE